MERSRRAQLASRLYHQGGYTIGALVIVIVILLAMACQEAESSLFTLVSPGHSGITFENTITESDSFNILDYEYLYNGGGVALADFNNDGQLDVFFTGNMVANRLYLNEGHLIFREISEAAGVQAVGSWCSGVAVVDINCDGWLDLYIAVNTHEPARRRQNLLFVNQGLNGDEGEIAFREEAASYGLADTSHTMNAVFFDYDNDEDLDVFLIVNEMQDSRNPSQYREKKVEQDARRVDRLYRNDWNDSLEVPFYVNVSAEAGISVAGYSLGVNVVDINSDGWKDIYISNDFISNDVFYINNQDGTFKDAANELFKHTSHSAMGNDVADLNNDGMLDILTLDMLPEDNYRKKTMLGPVNYMSYINNRKFGYDHQYVRNTLQLNQGVDPESGKVVFSEVAFFAGISATDWSWTPLVADFDHNTYRDLIITNGFPKDITDRDFVDYQVDVQAYASKPFLLERIPEVKLKNYAYRNMGSLVFEDVSESWGIDRTSFSNGAAYGDLDNDGDLDYVVNNINDTAFVYENLLKHGTVDSSQHYLRIRLEGSAKNPQAQGATIRLQSGDLRQVYEYSIYRGYLSSIEGVAHFGMGQKPSVDSVTVTWPDGTSTTIMDVPVDQEIVISYETSKRETAAHQAPSNGTEPIWENTTASLHLNFIHEEFDYVDFNVQPLLPHKLSQYGPGLAVGDINSDGLADLYVTGSTFHSGSLFLQQPDGSFKDSDWKQSEEDKRHEELGALFFDVDNDQDDDLYLVSGGYEFNPQDSFYYDRLYVNDGGELKLTEKVIPQLASSGSCVRAADFDKDGDLDLFVAGRVHPHEYPRPVSSYLLENKLNEGSLRFEVVNDSKAKSLNDIGMISDALWTDVDNDHWIDLVLAGEWMPITFIRNNYGVLEDQTKHSGLEHHVGWWNSLVPGDVDADGDVDYVAGNFGRNMLFPVSDQYPVRVYAKDFDNNGGYDAFISAYFKDQNGDLSEYPLHGRGDLAKQMISIKDQFAFHRDIATATIHDIFSEHQLADAMVLEANNLRTSLIENLGDGKFSVHALPDAAQFAPVYGGLIQDMDEDGTNDIALVGNDFGMELITGRCDALNGLVLLGGNDLSFQSISLANSGLHVTGDAKAMIQLQTSSGPLHLVSQNQGQLLAFRRKESKPSIPIALQEMDQSIHYTVEGARQKIEAYYGQGFLSQSDRIVYLPLAATNILIEDFRGATRNYTPSNQVIK